jgi:hypothetical protein
VLVDNQCIDFQIGESRRLRAASSSTQAAGK